MASRPRKKLARTPTSQYEVLRVETDRDDGTVLDGDGTRSRSAICYRQTREQQLLTPHSRVVLSTNRRAGRRTRPGGVGVIYQRLCTQFQYNEQLNRR